MPVSLSHQAQTFACEFDRPGQNKAHTRHCLCDACRSRHLFASCRDGQICSPQIFARCLHCERSSKERARRSIARFRVDAAETLNGTFLCGEACSMPRWSAGGVKGAKENDGPSVPEDVALKATHNLLEEIYRGGCVDSSNQYLAFVFMVLNQKDVSRVLSGILSPFS
jgi:hypothetical protein